MSQFWAGCVVGLVAGGLVTVFCIIPLIVALLPKGPDDYGTDDESEPKEVPGGPKA